MIIDFHTHAFPEAIASRTLASLAAVAPIKPHGDGTKASVERNLRASGADLAVVLNIATRPGQETTINSVAAQNDYFVSGKGCTVYFGSVHPKSESALYELSRIKALGLRGVKFHPDYQGFMIDDESAFPLYEKLEKLGLITVFHAGWDPLSPDLVHAPAERCANVARTFPKLKLVFAHFGSLGLYDETEKHLAGKFENVYLDTSCSRGYLDTKQARRIIDAQGPEKILMGSDYPWQTTEDALCFLSEIGLSDDEKELICHQNAARLLGMDA